MTKPNKSKIPVMPSSNLTDSDKFDSDKMPIDFPEEDSSPPLISTAIIQGEDGTPKCTVRIGKERPPTFFGGQGRHVSAYALILKVIKKSIEGEEIKNIKNKLLQLIDAYINDDEKTQYYITAIKQIEKKAAILDEYERRKSVYKSDKATERFLSSESTLNVMTQLRSSKSNNVKEMLRLFDEMESRYNQRLISPEGVRNLAKRAQETYSPILQDLLAITITVFNRAEHASLDHPQPTKGDKDDDSVGENKAIQYLEYGLGNYIKEDKKTINYEEMGKDIAALFDYKYDLLRKDFEKKKKEQGGNFDEDEEEKKLRYNCYHVMRRHIKLVHDGFDLIKDLMKDENHKKGIITAFAKQVLEKEGWKALKDTMTTFESSEKLCERILSDDRLKFQNGICTIESKPEIKKKHGDIVKIREDARGGPPSKIPVPSHRIKVDKKVTQKN